MRVLIAAATEGEIVAVRRRVRRDVDVLVTGVGMVSMAARCARALAEQRYDLALNVGVCGSFDRTLVPGVVVHVVRDRIAELGAEDGESFLTLDEIGMPAECVFLNTQPPDNAVLRELPRVDGITVNTVHGHEPSIAAVRARFQPQVESMEGAAFMCACLAARIPFAQIRAVSNTVERRNRGAWRLADAIASLAQVTERILAPA